ncbi:hypothetical protein BST61_g8116 [Cercospora zeina]
MAPRNTKRAVKPKPGALERSVSFGEDRDGQTRISRPGTSPTSPPGRRYPLTSPPLTRAKKATPKKKKISSPKPPPAPKKAKPFREPDELPKLPTWNDYDYEREEYNWLHFGEEKTWDDVCREEKAKVEARQAEWKKTHPLEEECGFEWEDPFDYATPIHDSQFSFKVPRAPTKLHPIRSPNAFKELPALPFYTGPPHRATSDDWDSFATEIAPLSPEPASDRSLSHVLPLKDNFIIDTVWENHNLIVLSNGNVVPKSPEGCRRLVHQPVQDDNGYFLYAGLHGIMDDNKTRISHKHPQFKAKVSARGEPLWENQHMAVYRNGTLRFKSYGSFVALLGLMPELTRTPSPTPSRSQKTRMASTPPSASKGKVGSGISSSAKVSREPSAKAKKNRKAREKKALAKLNAGRREKVPHIPKEASAEGKRVTRSRAKAQDNKFFALP